MREPLISVVIPVYNRADALRRTLKSVLTQNYHHLEILVIDDGSDIDISSVMKELDDHRLYYHKLEHTNANVARNFGIDNSQGAYIAMLDADDLWMENHVTSCLDKLLESGADGIYGSLVLRNIANQTEKNVMVRPVAKNETMINYLLSTGYGAQTSTLFMTAESIKDIRWNPVLERHQDYDFVIRYSKKYRLAAKSEPTAIYISGEPKQVKINFQSCIQVIKENEEDISPSLYNSYHLNMLSLARHLNAPANVIKHYKQEATFYKEHLSYYRFLIIRQPGSGLEKFRCKLEYLFYILRTRVE